MAVSLEKIVSGPVTEPPLHSLLTTAHDATEDPVPVGVEDKGSWEGGFTFQPEGCVQASTWNPCSTGDDRNKSDIDPPPGAVVVEPFIIEIGYECTSTGWQAANYEEKASARLDAALSKALEYEFWTGDRSSDNPSLMTSTPNDDEHILNPGGAEAPVAVSPAQGLILIAEALSRCGSGARGTLHVTSGVGEFLTQKSLVEPDDNGNLETGGRGDVVIIGSGYTGQGPVGDPEDDDQADAQPDPAVGTSWIYATGPVAYRVGEPEVLPTQFFEAFDRATNTVTYRSERTAAVYHDGCCIFAVLVDYSLD